MKRIYEPRAYGPEPIKHGFWQTTIESLDQPALQGTHQTDVAIIGGGFTGLNAALHLAEDGVDVTLLDAETIVLAHLVAMAGFVVWAAVSLTTNRSTRFTGVTHVVIGVPQKRMQSHTLPPYLSVSKSTLIRTLTAKHCSRTNPSASQHSNITRKR